MIGSGLHLAGGPLAFGLALCAALACSSSGGGQARDEGPAGATDAGGSPEGSGESRCATFLQCTRIPSLICSGLACTGSMSSTAGTFVSTRTCSDGRTTCTAEASGADGNVSGTVTCTGELSCSSEWSSEVSSGSGEAPSCDTAEDCIDQGADDAECIDGTCVLRCVDGLADCDGRWVNGCETELGDPETCGTSCADVRACPDANGEASCTSGVCGIDCEFGFADCRGGDDGCETLLDDPATCGTTCTDLVGCPDVNGWATCDEGQCGIDCDDGFADCDERDGCETELNDPFTCGSTCDGLERCPGAGEGATCEAGECGSSCNDGYADCDRDGECETNLTDPATCGTSCSNIIDCSSAGPDVKCGPGRCLLVLAEGQQSPQGIAIDRTSVYWTSFGEAAASGTVSKVPLDGGDVVTLATGQDGANGIAVDATHVYWTNYGGDGRGAVLKVPLGGGEAVPLVTGLDSPAFIAVDATHVYFTIYGAFYASDAAGAVMKVSLGGGTVATLVSGETAGHDIALDPSRLYWTGGGGVNRLLLEGDSSVPLATGYGNPFGIAVDATSVYFSASRDGVIGKVPLGGGAVTELVSGEGEPLSIAVDSSAIYWLDGFEGEVRKVPLGGGAVTTIASGLVGDMGDIAVDATSVYWTDSAAGTVTKATPK